MNESNATRDSSFGDFGTYYTRVQSVGLNLNAATVGIGLILEFEPPRSAKSRSIRARPARMDLYGKTRHRFPLSGQIFRRPFRHWAQVEVA